MKVSVSFTDDQLKALLWESNLIEGIDKPITEKQIEASRYIIETQQVGVADLSNWVLLFQPDGLLRDQYKMNVRVGVHIPPGGGPHITSRLESLMIQMRRGRASAYKCHIDYLNLHPFMDGNGRSGRILLLWQAWHHEPKLFMDALQNGLLHTWYMETMRQNSR